MIAYRPAQAIIDFFTAISDFAPTPGALQPIAEMLAFRATGLSPSPNA